MNKALIAFWSYNKKDKNGDMQEIKVERLVGIYKYYKEAEFIEKKAKRNFEVNCNFKIEDTKNKVTTGAIGSVMNYIRHLQGRALNG